MTFYWRCVRCGLLLRGAQRPSGAIAATNRAAHNTEAEARACLCMRCAA